MGDAQMIVDRVLLEIEDGDDAAPGYTEVITFEELAVYYATIGDAAKSQEYLVRAVAASPAGMEFRLFDSGLYDRVRGDHNFKAATGAIRSELYDRVRRLSARLDPQPIQHPMPLDDR